MRSGGMEDSVSNTAIFPSACTPESVRLAPMTSTGSLQQIRQTAVQLTLNRNTVILDLPAVIIRTVVGHGQADTLFFFFRLL